LMRTVVSRNPIRTIELWHKILYNIYIVNESRGRRCDGVF
jgi:hypothetical protein